MIELTHIGTNLPYEELSPSRMPPHRELSPSRLNGAEKIEVIRPECEMSGVVVFESSRDSEAGIEQEPRSIKMVITPLAAAFVASIAYVDPGNFATNVQGGSEFGYTLLWVVVLANMMAMLFQFLSAKLGISSRMNLGRCCREHFHPRLNILLWIIAEIAAIATDIAEFVGAAIGFKILFGFPLIAGAAVTTVTTFLMLVIRDRGLRMFEIIVVGFVSVIALCFLVETTLGSVDWYEVGTHIVVPGLQGPDSALLAVGIVGATVMPHAIYLHSALVLDRKPIISKGVKSIYRYEFTAIIIALTVAGMVNMAVLIMAASSFHDTGRTNVATLEDAYVTLSSILGHASSYVFAIGLIASGISSSAIGTLSGQIIMEGFIDYKMSVWTRRLMTLVPSVSVILSGVDPTYALVVSQVVLSFCIPFALVPLVWFTSNKRIVGVEWVNRMTTIVLASIFTTIIVGMNIFLIYSTIKN